MGEAGCSATRILSALDLGEYATRFQRKGCKDVHTLMSMSREEFLDVTGEERAASHLADSKEVWNYLKNLALERYAEAFFKQGYDQLDQVRDMTNQQLEECGMKPGHRVKFLRRVHSLNPEGATASGHQPPMPPRCSTAAVEQPPVNNESNNERGVFKRLFIHLEKLFEHSVSDILKSKQQCDILGLQADLRACKASAWDEKQYCDTYNKVKDIKLRDGLKPYQHDHRCALNKVALLPTLEACLTGEYQRAEDAPMQRLRLAMIENEVYNADRIKGLEREVPAEQFTACEKTEVFIREADCLCLAEEVSRNTGVKPMILNMANPDHPGGGFDNGRLAQEEDMFRRTTLVAATPGPFDFFLPKRGTHLYPLGEFSILYTKNVEILRGEQDKGLPFLETPILFDSLACAAYQVSLGNRLMEMHNTSVAPTRRIKEAVKPLQGKERPLDPLELNNRNELELTPTYAMLTYQKLRSLLLVARKENKKILILSALGCGAFGNPCEHIAFIFREIISEFAGAFEKIYFAIIKGRNLDMFKKVFNVDVNGSASFHRLARLPRRIWQPEQQFTMLAEKKKRLCRYGGACRNLWAVGLEKGLTCTEEFHPAICPREKCSGAEGADKHQRWHAELYSHPMSCQFGATCPKCDAKIKNGTTEELHHLVATHDYEKCSDWNKCNNRASEHERMFSHPPLCQHPLSSCTGDALHMAVFRHLQPAETCLETVCLQCMDPEHVSRFHQWFDQKENLWKPKKLCEFMHCRRNRNPEHVKQELHLAMDQCCVESDGMTCLNSDPDHLDTCFHKQSGRRFAKVCRYGRRCEDTNWEHHLEYRHLLGPQEKLLCPPYEQRPFHQPLDHKANIQQLHTDLVEYLNMLKFDASNKNFKEIAEMVRHLRPVHRCKAETFASILKAQKLYSLSRLCGDASSGVLSLAEQQVSDKCHHWGFNKESYGLALNFIEALKNGKSNPTIVESKRKICQQKLGFDKVDKMEKIFREMSAWEEETKKSRPGIGYGGDKINGLDDTVFAILGPHNTEYYGQIQLIFDPQVMLHPDSYFLPCAGTYFNSGTYHTFQGQSSDSPKIERKWIPTPTKTGKAVDEETARRTFMESTWHCSVDEWWKTIAMELVARVAGWKKCSVNQVKWADILNFNDACEGHSWLEAHLPRELPLQYVTDIVMPKKDLGLLKDKSGNVVKTGSLEEMEGLGWSQKSITDKFHVRIHIGNDHKHVKELGKTLATKQKATFPAGMLFTTQQLSDDPYHPPAGLVVRGTSSWIFRFKATANVAFNLILTSSAWRLAREGAPLTAVHAPQDEHVIIVKFLEQGDVHITSEGPEGDVHKTYQDFNIAVPDKGNRPEFIDYLVELCPKKLYLEHAGMSAILLARPSIAFDLTRPFTGTLYVGCSAENAGDPITIADLRPLDARPPEIREKFNSIIKDPRRQLPSLMPKQHLQPEPLPLCTEAAALNLPIEMCPLRKDKKHCQKVSHPCPFAEDCKFVKEPKRKFTQSKEWQEHFTEHVHKRQKLCPEGQKCKQINNPSHRVEFGHAGCRAWISPCSKTCTKKSAEHMLNFCHDDSLTDTLEQACMNQFQ